LPTDTHELVAAVVSTRISPVVSTRNSHGAQVLALATAMGNRCWQLFHIFLF
jgi:hypothetical protein